MIKIGFNINPIYKIFIRVIISKFSVDRKSKMNHSFKKKKKIIYTKGYHYFKHICVYIYNFDIKEMIFLTHILTVVPLSTT